VIRLSPLPKEISTVTNLALAPQVATVPTTALQRAVADVSRIIPARPPVPVMAGLVVEAGPDGLYLSSFDYTTSIRVQVDDGAFPAAYGIATAKRLSDLLKHHDKAGLSSLIVGETEWHLTQGAMDASGKLLPAADYPKLPTVKGVWVFQIDGKSLLEAAKRAHNAAGRDQTLPVLQCVQLDLVANQVELASTDRYRLSVEQIPVTRNRRVTLLKDWGPAKVHSATLVDIATILKDQDDIRVQWDKEIVVFRTDTTTITTRVEEGQFPNYRRLLPTEFETTATVDRDLFVKRLKYVAEGCARNEPVKVEVSEAGLTLVADGDESTTKASLPVGRFVGGSGTIAFNPKFLQDGLSVLGKSVTIGMTATTKPAVFFTEGDDDYRYLLMPVRINR
jgi:DNA polymerase-3 subunit beta